MKIRSQKLVCFSPTGTTKAIIQNIARGIVSLLRQLVPLGNNRGCRHKLVSDRSASTGDVRADVTGV